MSVLEVNGRRYALPQHPLVVVCIDGCEPDYLEAAITAGVAPWFARIKAEGTWRTADCAMPSFTNPNNLSIVTGVPPAIHGICGNYLWDRESGQEVMMNDVKWLRAPTLLAALEAAGRTVAVITAKDKLRALLGHGLTRGLCFSSEKADSADLSAVGIASVPDFVGLPVPGVYSAGLSEFIFAAGVRLMAHCRPDVMYLSTTDYIQHKHAPGTPEANALYAAIDTQLAALEAMGCTVAVTADHGMKAKTRPDGSPDVAYLQDALDAALGAGQSRVILPITDPYVVHHGALGSYATVYVAEADLAAATACLKALPQVARILSRAEAAQALELPADRIGDLVIIATDHAVLGTTASRHDLSGLDAPLRSHGGLSEQRVPLLVNRPCPGLPTDRRLRNFDVFDLALNYAQGPAADVADSTEEAAQ